MLRHFPAVATETRRSLLCCRNGGGFDERSRVRDPKSPECRCDKNESGTYAARRSREPLAARRLATDDLMYSLMRQAKLLGDLPERGAAAVEVEDSRVVGGALRFGHIEGSFVFLA